METENDDDDDDLEVIAEPAAEDSDDPQEGTSCKRRKINHQPEVDDDLIMLDDF